MSKPWADGPYSLLASPKAKLGDQPESGASAFATEMVHAHNVFIRGINSMTRQAANVASPKDVQDFMLYAKTWIKNLHGHHATEEDVGFPLFEDETGVDGIMNTNMVQHEAFRPGIDAFSEYVEAVLNKTSAYDGHKLVELIASFATLLTTHLKDEINTILNLEQYDIDWDKCNKRFTDYAIQSLDMDFDIGFVMTHVDSTFEGGLHKDTFPPFPWYASMLFRWVYVPRKKDVWRFSPCDTYFKPKELPFA